MFGKILCPIDFSPPADVALTLAARLAAGSGAELVVTHAWQVTPTAYAGEYTMPADTIAELKADDERGLAAAVADATKLGAARVSSRWVEGTAWDQIVSTAQTGRFDLIVIGTHGRTGMSRFLLGSIAEKVVRHATCSVLVARDRSGTPPFHRVLCPSDLSDSSHDAIRQAAELVAPDGTLVLTHALQIPAMTRATPAPELLAEADQRATHTLEQWAKELGPKVRAKVATTMATSGPATQVLATVEQDPTFDLIAVGSRGRTGIRRVLLGSVAERIVRHAPCSVLVARKPD